MSTTHPPVERKIRLIATEGIFQGLAKQNILFHQCLGELVDNAIAAKNADKKFRVDVIFSPKAGDQAIVDLYVADNSTGMTADHLEKALQLGESASSQSRLNEHGFGLKNALATLSGGNGSWKIWTRTSSGICCSVEGPFRPEMVVKEGDVFPEQAFLPSDISTLVSVSVKLNFLQTVQGRGAPAYDLVNLREWLIEHLGVMYRGYLDNDSNTYDTSGVIVVSIANDSVQVPPIPVPLGKAETKYFSVELGGKVERLEYRFGTLDEVKRDMLVRGKRARFYYQNNIPTQGIDIRLGKRVIAMRQFETIWKTEKGDSQLNRHNNYNDFAGELIIPELARGVLTTVNSKTDFNLDDQDWAKIFTNLNEIRPPKQIREKSESELKKTWISMIKATNPDDVVTDEMSVWPTGAYIDIYRRLQNGKIIIYELKVGSGSPQHLYQLKMYWDGLVVDKKEKPSEAFLFVEDFSTNLEEMANMMNKIPPPPNSHPYNFKIERLRDKGL